MATVDLPRICLDTGPLIQYLRGREPGASAVEKAVRGSACHLTSITADELLFGAARARRRLDEQDLPGVMVVLPFDVSGAQRAAQLHAELIGRPQDVGVKDVLTAAICLEHALPLLTMNARHFERIPSLRIFSVEEFVQEESR